MTKQEVLEVISKASRTDIALRKSDILGDLYDGDTKESRKQLDKILKELKDEGTIDVFQIYGFENHFIGRGYALKK